MAGHPELVVLLVLVAVAALLALSQRVRVPYPILLVIGGALLGLVPGVPEIELEPEAVLLGVLPPLLYYAGYLSSLRELRDNARPLTLLATGLVLLTATLVAVLFHTVLGLDWAVAFTLGAVLSPTDPVAATSIARRLGAPRRTVGLLEGESLVNDAGALVLYRVAVAAVVTGSFSAGEAVLDFVVGAVIGVAVGGAVGFGLEQALRRITDAPLAITLALFGAYFAYLPAEVLGASAVLAVVTAGVWVGWRAPGSAAPGVRLAGFGFWDTIVFLINALLFVLLGLQLPVVLSELEGDRSAAELAGAGALACAAVIGTRFLWLFTVPYLVRLVDRRPAQRARRVGWRERVVFGWSGMRGAVSLAAALAIPTTVASGAPFPDRDLILFLTYVVILVTLVVQGLTLPALIRRLGVTEDPSGAQAAEARARELAARAALDRIAELEAEAWLREDTAERVRAQYEYRRRRWAARAGGDAGGDGDGAYEARTDAYKRLIGELVAAQRATVLGLGARGDLDAEAVRRIERDLDLEQSRLAETD